MVGQRARRLQIHAHVDEQVADGRQLVDRHAELLARQGVVARRAAGGLADAEALRGDAEARAVHQAHHVGDQPALALADQLGRRVVEEDLAGRAAVDAELVLEAAHLHLRPLLDQQAGEAAPVGDLRLGARQHEQDVAAAVGDEALDAVHEPLARRVLVGARLDGLQVAAGVGLGQHHGPGPLAARQARQVGLLDLVAGEGMDRLGDALEAVEVHQRGVGPADDVVGHRVEQFRRIEAAVAVRQGEAHQVGLPEQADRLGDAGRVGHGAVGIEHVAGGVGVLRRRRDALPGDPADEFQQAAVVVDGVGGIGRREVELRLEAELLLRQRRQAAQVEVVEEETDVLVVVEEVCHGMRLRGGVQAWGWACWRTTCSSVAPPRIALISIGRTSLRSPTMP